MANGSAAELETQLLLALRIFKIQNIQQSLDLLIEVQKMLSTIITRLKSE